MNQARRALKPTEKTAIQAWVLRFFPLRTLWFVCFCQWLCCSSFGCSGAQSVVQPAELITLQADDKPPLVTIERHGDPLAALAMAVWFPGGEHAVAALGQTVERALRTRGLRPTLRLSSESLIVSVPLPQSAAPSTVFQAFRAALFDEHLSKVSAPRARADLCTGNREPSTAQALREALGTRNVAFAVVGSDQALQDVAAAYESAGAWPIGTPPDDPWPEAERYSERTAAGAEQLRIGARVPDGARALAVARELGRSDSTLGLLASAQAPGFSVERVSASLRPRGACLELELQAPPASRRQAARLARAIVLELQARLEASTPLRTELLPLEAERASGAAERAAWAALSSRREPEQPRFAFERVTVEGGDAAALEREIRAAARPRFRVEQAHEPGQGRLWLLLTSRCPTVHEDAATAGHTAAALAAAARHAQSRLAAGSVEPWQSWRGLGLLASVPAHDGEAASRLAEALGRGLLAATTDERLIAETRRELLGANPPAPVWEFSLRLASDGHPSQLLPQGFAATAQDLQLPAASHALRRWLDGELELALLTNVEAGQAEQVVARLEPLLFPLGPQASACPKPEPPTALAGEFSLASDPNQAVLIFPIPVAELATAEAAVVALNGRGGWLRRAVVEPGLAGAAEAYALGTRGGRAALAISVVAQAETLQPAVMQVRALLDRLASTRWTTSSLARIEAHLAGARDRSDPRVRLSGLLEAPQEPLTGARLASFFRTQLRRDRLILVRPQPEVVAP